jgi:predicted Zn-dependent protease
MGKLFYQLSGLLFLFFGTWFLLSQIPFTNYYNFKELGERNEESIAQLMLKYISVNSQTIESPQADSIIYGLKEILCANSTISSEKLQVHLIKQPDVNAFALPANHLVILSGLIQFCQTPEELAGVMAHEMAHMEHNHVTKRMVKELGLTVVMSMISGNSGGQTIKEAVKLVSSSAFDRSQEIEADETAVRLLVESGIDPIHLANFFERLAESEPGVVNHFTWISTHPQTLERANEVRRLAKGYTLKNQKILSDEEWKTLKEIVSN